MELVPKPKAVPAPKPKGEPVLDVVLIGHYMSGDRYTLASALALNERLLVAVVGPHVPATTELRDYFVSKLGAKRVLWLQTESRPEAEAVLALVKRPELHAAKLGEVAKALKLIGVKVLFHAPSFATAVVADAFSRRYRDVADSARSRLLAFWSVGEAEERYADFLLRRGFKPGKRYAFLWCKKGTVGGEKAHHYTDRRSWANLAAEIAVGSGGFFPVFTGDDIGLATEPNLTEYWKDWAALYGKPMTRDLQLGFWAFIARNMAANCCAIGMRSGMLEVPALLGIRTLYLEEVENEQRTRMAKWLSVVDTWYRGVMFKPVGTLQTVYWTRLMVRHASYPSVVARLNSSAKMLAFRAEYETRFWVSVALRHLRRRNIDTYLIAKQLVLDYLGYDIDIPETAMADIAIFGIVDWVGGKAPAITGGEEVATRVIKDVLPLAIEGGVAAPVAKVSKKPSPEELAELRRQKEEAKKAKGAASGGASAQKAVRRPSPPPPPTRYGPKP